MNLRWRWSIESPSNVFVTVFEAEKYICEWESDLLEGMTLVAERSLCELAPWTRPSAYAKYEVSHIHMVESNIPGGEGRGEELERKYSP